MKNKTPLIISIILFIFLSIVAFFIIINKGHIGSYSLVYIGDSRELGKEEVILPKLTLELEKEYLASNNKKDKSSMTVTTDGEIVTDGVEFESSDEKIAKINSNNEIVPVSDGKVNITAKYDGMEATKEIRVITPIKTMNFTTTNSTIRVGKDLQMKLKLTPSNASTETLTYTSSDESIATVNSNGIVTGISAGKVTITIYDSYTETEKSVNLTIKK